MKKSVNVSIMSEGNFLLTLVLHMLHLKTGIILTGHHTNSFKERFTTEGKICRHIDRQLDIQRDKETDRWTDGQMDTCG